MALRVLLADNSETIKKVIQITLQDFGLDLRVVSVGVDVLDVASQFKPDIIFVDVLLQKTSGYEVSRALKTHPELKSIPVVLIWSNFMELDEAKVKDSLADFRLEKPFEPTQLRSIIQKLVKKTETNPLGEFLDFPSIPKDKEIPSADPLAELQKIQDESKKFQTTPSASEPLAPPPPSSTPFQDEDFESKDTAIFTVQIPEDSDPNDLDIELHDIDPVEDMSFLLNPSEEQLASPPPPPPLAPPPPIPQPPAPQEITRTNLSDIPLPGHAELEKMVHSQVSEILEKIAWQVVPELAGQIIKKELERLLKDQEPTP